MRADVFLFAHGLAKSRSHAAVLIAAGVTVAGKKVDKPSQDIPDSIPAGLVHIDNPTKFVGRGGIKLEYALGAFGISPSGFVTLDLGASTGGFTDCLLQYGAVKVYAVDVGHGQLDGKLSHDSRVVNMEGVNARTLTPDAIGGQVSIITSDLSFISQSLVYPAVSGLLLDGGCFISLIKPQFEAGRENLDKNGIVKNRKVHAEVIKNLFMQARRCSLFPAALDVSPIEGGDGNREYLALFIKSGACAPISDRTILQYVNS